MGTLRLSVADNAAKNRERSEDEEVGRKLKVSEGVKAWVASMLDCEHIRKSSNRHET